ncbi:hypothetical protein BKA70DRAFT_344018 [Coprinopsis sp. MPI-PUGE-AT-0042]|nr:hypothetical protein BKA70DRAFT_344018 [Coprinopsis sp. MPI-PUGE-AT-0042]
MRSRVLAMLIYSQHLLVVSTDTTLRRTPGRTSLSQELLFMDLPPHRLMDVQGSRDGLRCGTSLTSLSYELPVDQGGSVTDVGN